MSSTWINGPVGYGSERRRTLSTIRTALVMIPNLVAGVRLMDLVPLLESDSRIQTVFTVPHTLTVSPGAANFVEAQGGTVLPWQQALNHEFDLVLAASRRGTDEVRGPVMLLSHSASVIKSRIRSRSTGSAALPRHSLDREELIRQGRLVPSALVLSHDYELNVLRSSCPEAVPMAVVAGDPCLDRMLASGPYREHYRQALGAHPEQTLVVVQSTWSGMSLFGQCLDLYRRLADELPSARYRLVASLHPNIWTAHGQRQVRAWLSDCTDRGMLLLPPDEGWRAALIAGDVLVGDHGSATVYGAAVGVPTLLATFADDNIRPDSAAALLGRTTPRLHPEQSLRNRLADAIRGTTALTATRLIHRLTSRPRQAAVILRRTMYKMLAIPEPAHAVPVTQLPLPQPLPTNLVGRHPEETS